MKIKILERELYKQMNNLENLGESSVINLLQIYIDRSDLLGTNEDAYLYKNILPYILVNVDTMSRDSDFLPKQTWKQLGAKLVTITFSDLVAKGATPDLFLSSLVLEGSMKEDELKELVSAIQKTSHQYGARYLGGDLGSSTETVLTGVGLGSIKKGNILTRRDAKKGDLVCVTGYFGLTTIGLDYLLSPMNRKYDPIPDELLELSMKLLHEPQLRLTEGLLLSKNSLATSSIDSSDGLAISLHWLSQASNVGIIVNNLPIYPELESFLESFDMIQDVSLFGGEEYELIFTVPPSKLEKLKHIFRKHKCQFFIIGECVDSKGVFVSQKESLTPVPMKGWDTFRKEVL
ncbi:MAG: thiamine-phosphate kinase [Candidatus Heimdallarchaeota archaeon]|nr:MAG: thiamine-phosphate kinase [Candidatus Heimdallarchaeota archaeon]